MIKSECPSCLKESIVFEETEELNIVRCTLCKFKIDMPIPPIQEFTFKKGNPDLIKQKLKDIKKSIKESGCLTEDGESNFMRGVYYD